MIEQIKSQEQKPSEKYKVESPYLAEDFRGEDAEYQYEEIRTPYSRGTYHFVIETVSGKKFLEKYPEGDEPTVYETRDFINEFFESELLKAALANGILNKENIVVPSIKLQPKQGDHAYYSEFISDIWDPISPPEYRTLENLTDEKFKKISKNYATFNGLLNKEENAAPLAILHLIAGDKDRVFSNYKLQIQKEGDNEKYNLVILDMAGGGQRTTESAIGRVLLKNIQKEQVLPYLKNIREFITPEFVDNIIDQTSMSKESRDKKKAEVLNNLQNIESILDEEYKLIHEEVPHKDGGSIGFKNEAEILNLESGENKIITEIGCGSHPYFTRTKEKIAKGEYYIGIDLPEQYIAEPEDEEQRLFMPRQASMFRKEDLRNNIENNKELVEGKADFIIASGLKIPLKDNSTDSVVFSGVLGAPTEYFTGAGFSRSINDFNKFCESPLMQEYIEQLTSEEKEWLEYQKTIYIRNLKNADSVVLSHLGLAVEYQIREKNIKRHDEITTLETLFTRDVKKKLLDEALRVLKINGELVIFDHDREFYNELGVSIDELEKRFKFIKKETIHKSEHDEDFKLIFKKV